MRVTVIVPRGLYESLSAELEILKTKRLAPRMGRLQAGPVIQALLLAVHEADQKCRRGAAAMAMPMLVSVEREWLPILATGLERVGHRGSRLASWSERVANLLSCRVRREYERSPVDVLADLASAKPREIQ